jgi:hypothetical protein
LGLYILRSKKLYECRGEGENEIDRILAIVAALIVLFTAMINAISSVIIAIAGLIIYSIYKFTRRK